MKTEHMLSFQDREAALFLAILSRSSQKKLSYLTFTQTIPVTTTHSSQIFMGHINISHWPPHPRSHAFLVLVVVSWVGVLGSEFNTKAMISDILPAYSLFFFWSNSYNTGQKHSAHDLFNNSILEKLISKQCMYHA